MSDQPGIGTLQARKDRIFLTGFMGSGKSTIGPILANTLGYDFLDLDHAIEEQEHCSISDIFREHGEAYFRQLERKALIGISTKPCMVVALGGGTLTDPGSRGLVRSSGILVYLKLSREQVFHRLRRRNDRPLLHGPGGEPLSDEALHARIRELYDAREPLYADADLTIATDASRLGLTIDTIVRRITPILG